MKNRRILQIIIDNISLSPSRSSGVQMITPGYNIGSKKQHFVSRKMGFWGPPFLE
jgi:hypothetical protein